MFKKQYLIVVQLSSITVESMRLCVQSGLEHQLSRAINKGSPVLTSTPIPCPENINVTGNLTVFIYSEKDFVTPLRDAIALAWQKHQALNVIGQ